MGEQETKKEDLKDLRRGKLFLSLFLFLIVGGIVTKRVYGHPEWMMAWHLPAAVFLVLGGKRLTRHQRERYYLKKFLVKTDLGS